MKSLIILFALILTNNVFAADAAQLIAKMQLALDKNLPEEVEDIFENNETLFDKNIEAHERLAISYERRSKYKEATETYKKIIIKFYSAENTQILQSANPDASLYQNNKLPFYYYKQAFLNGMLFKSSNKYMSLDDRKKYLGNVQAYLQLCKKTQVGQNEIASIEEMVKEKIKFDSERSFKANWYSFVDIISWQDSVKLINTSTHAKTNILSTALGTTIGFGKKWQNINHEFDSDLSVSLAKATASSENTSVTYQQSSVSVAMLNLVPGYYYKGWSEKASFGVAMPITYRTGDWTTPSGNFKLDDTKQIGVGYYFQIKFLLENISFQTRLGKVFPNPGSTWSIGGIYDF